MSQGNVYSDIPRDASDLAQASLSDLRARTLNRLLSGLNYGRLFVILPNGQVVYRVGAEPGPEATIALVRWRALRRLLTAGDIGFAEAFIDGDWTSPNLAAVVRLAARNSDAMAGTISGSTAMRLLNRVRHHFNANSRLGSQRNILAHYDLGNAFYRQWLDASMSYSSALWTDDAMSLEEAQACKIERVSALLQVKPGQRVLEIGCGWGALTARLAADSRSHVTGITLSPSQLDWARGVVANRDAADRVALRIQDYRDLDETFDRIVSIEMFEAVGKAYWPTYFSTLKSCLKPGGRAVLQVISIAEERFDNYLRETDFIQKHIFPGGFLPSKTHLREEVERAGLRVTASEFFGQSYARTLIEWRQRFHRNWPMIERLGFDDRFRRTWDYYLSYCEAGFQEGAIDVGLYTIEHRAAA